MVRKPSNWALLSVSARSSPPEAAQHQFEIPSSTGAAPTSASPAGMAGRHPVVALHARLLHRPVRPPRASAVPHHRKAGDAAARCAGVPTISSPGAPGRAVGAFLAPPVLAFWRSFFRRSTRSGDCR
jgi:hypothetical protein